MSDRDQVGGGTMTSVDTCAGPDIAPFGDPESGEHFDDSEFRPAHEVFSGGDLDFLQQHGSQSSSVSHLARQSLYVKFDPLIGGRPSVMGRPSVAPTYKPPSSNQELIDMNSPSPCKKGGKTKEEVEEQEGDGSVNEEELKIREQEFQEGLLQREQKLLALQKELELKTIEVEKLKEQLKKKLDSENQMKEVVAEYERTISELIADKEKEKEQLEADVARMISEKNQAVDDLQNVESAFADVHRKYERTKQVVEGFKKNE